MSKMSQGNKELLSMSELTLAVRENTFVLQQNIEETKRLSELLRPGMKKAEAVKIRQFENQQVYNDALNAIRRTK